MMRPTLIGQVSRITFDALFASAAKKNNNKCQQQMFKFLLFNVGKTSAEFYCMKIDLNFCKIVIEF